MAHGRVNGVDFWSEEAGHGYQVHAGFDAVQSGRVFGRIVQRVSWRREAPDGAPVLEERRTLTFWNTPATARLLDLAVTVHAAHGDVTFGDTKEGGLCSLRVPEAIKGARGGVISNAYGGIHEAEIWGQRAPWVDYSGELIDPGGRRRTVGVAIFDHPRNPHYPTRGWRSSITRATRTTPRTGTYAGMGCSRPTRSGWPTTTAATGATATGPSPPVSRPRSATGCCGTPATRTPRG